jgi:hypothetical protein
MQYIPLQCQPINDKALALQQGELPSPSERNRIGCKELTLRRGSRVTRGSNFWERVVTTLVSSLITRCSKLLISAINSFGPPSAGFLLQPQRTFSRN